MGKTDDDNNSVCSDVEQTTTETVIIKDKKDKKDKKNKNKSSNEENDEDHVNNKNDVDDEEDDDDDDEDDDDEDDDEDDEDEDDEEDEEEEEEDDDDDNNEFDTTIIQFEMMKNFFIDKEGENISTHLGSISHELRKLNKIAVKLLEKKN